VLDEAQNIKNPSTKQSQAVRLLKADYRIALTGTPVENHVGDLWSIMDFLNPGFLGTRQDFKRNYFVPIQAFRDREASERLHRIAGPFILRRLKSDRSIISDLPEKMEMKVFCTLTAEQGRLYTQVVEEMEKKIRDAEGIERRGAILATLTKLKQVCNHPVNYLGDDSEIDARSGKLTRLTEMLEEVIDAGDRSLVFTQFVEMGTLLQRHLQQELDREVLFLHGSVPKRRRDSLIERFQAEDSDAPPIFILSLKAGGLGLNLTAANHVEPGRREPGHRPRVPHRADAQRAGPQVRVRRHARGAHRRDDRAQAQGRRGHRRRRRNLDHRALERGAARHVCVAQGCGQRMSKRSAQRGAAERRPLPSEASAAKRER
jgi:SNF2 family DNA or RNA helicase